METTNQPGYKGPHAGMLAVIFMVLFNAGLSFVISFTGTPPYFPGPWESAETITAYFRDHSNDVLLCAFFQFCAAIPLGLFTAAVVTRIRLKVKAAGTFIALFGGMMTAFNLALSAMVLWVMAHPAISPNETLIPALYYLVFAIGGVGYSVPLGLLIAGVAVTSGITKMIPGWMMWSGLVIAVAGEVSCLSMVFPKLLFLIPLTRFPGFVWLILAGFKLSAGTQK